MASTPVTRATLIQRVALRANTSGYADASTIGGEVSQLVDVSMAKMHNLLVGLFEDYFIAINDLDIVSGKDTYTLPSDFFKLRQVFFVDVANNGYQWPIQRREIYDLSNRPISGSYPNVIWAYAMMGNSIVFTPKPQNAQPNKVRLYYIPEYSPPLNDNTPIEYSVAFGWDEWIVNDCVIQIRNKAMMPADEIIAERNDLEKNIRHQAKQRNAGDPQRVRNNGWNNSAYGRWGSFAIKG